MTLRALGHVSTLLVLTTTLVLSARAPLARSEFEIWAYTNPFERPPFDSVYITYQASQGYLCEGDEIYMIMIDGDDGFWDVEFTTGNDVGGTFVDHWPPDAPVTIAYAVQGFATNCEQGDVDDTAYTSIEPETPYADWVSLRDDWNAGPDCPGPTDLCMAGYRRGREYQLMSQWNFPLYGGAYVTEDVEETNYTCAPVAFGTQNTWTDSQGIFIDYLKRCPYVGTQCCTDSTCRNWFSQEIRVGGWLVGGFAFELSCIRVEWIVQWY